MADSELLIKINADTQGLQKGYEDAASKTEDLQGKLNDIAKISGVAFAALSAQVVASLSAFSDAQVASADLSNALQNQGIFTQDLKDKYKEYADQVSETSGISATQITKAQAAAQVYLGQIPITKNLTQAIADYSIKAGGATEAATQIARAIGTGTGMLLRQGLVFNATDTEAERYQKTLDFVTQRYGGLAEANNKATFGVGNLKNAFEESEIALGEKFAPAATLVVKALTDFLKPAKDASGEMVTLKAGLIAAGLAITGLGVALPLLANGFLAVRAAMVALEIGAAPLALIGVAVAALVIGVIELTAHWTQASALIKNVVQGLATFISGAFGGIGKVISGAFNLDPEKIKAGLSDIQKAFSDGVDKAAQEIPKATEKALEKQDQVKKVAADKAEKDRAGRESAQRALLAAENALELSKINEESAAVIALKQKEVDELKQLAAKKQGVDSGLLEKQLAETKSKLAAQLDLEKEQGDKLIEISAAAKKNLSDHNIKYDDELQKAELNSIRDSIQTQETTERNAYNTELKDKIKADNTFLAEQNKFGTAYAAINKIMHSSEVQGFKQASGDLADLYNSKNATLKAIGKRFTEANIIIKTAESAMNIYAGFSAIPFVGQALGVAGAAAAIAYGAEQLANVEGAQAGGMVAGAGFGDKMPFMLEPGELIAPRQNFNEVVNSVAASRGMTSSGQAEKTEPLQVHLNFNQDLGKIIETKIIERQRTGVSLLPKFT